MQTNHTPGPWVAKEQYRDCVTNIVDAAYTQYIGCFQAQPARTEDMDIEQIQPGDLHEWAKTRKAVLS